MSVPLVAVTSQVLDLQELVDELAKTGSGDGAITPFVGLVRDHNQGRRVEYLEYEAYETLAVRALNRIVDEARQAWADTRVAVHHRTVHTRSPRADTRSSASNRLCQSGNTSISPAGMSGSKAPPPIQMMRPPGRRRIESHARNDSTVCAAQGFGGLG